MILYCYLFNYRTESVIMVLICILYNLYNFINIINNQYLNLKLTNYVRRKIIQLILDSKL